MFSFWETRTTIIVGQLSNSTTIRPNNLLDGYIPPIHVGTSRALPFSTSTPFNIGRTQDTPLRNMIVLRRRTFCAFPFSTSTPPNIGRTQDTPLRNMIVPRRRTFHAFPFSHHERYLLSGEHMGIAPLAPDSFDKERIRVETLSR